MKTCIPTLPRRMALALMLAGASTAATAQGVVPGSGFAGGQYTAEFDSGVATWRLFPLVGSATELRSIGDCRASAPTPAGLWLITRGADGTPVLLAPSVTVLPVGHPGRIRLAACGSDAHGTEPTLRVPEALLDWLADHSGAVLVR